MVKRLLACALVLLFSLPVLGLALAAEEPASAPSDLDARYRDDNNDLVADPPQDQSKWKNPSTLAFTYPPLEDSFEYKEAFTDFQNFLAKKTGKRVAYYPIRSNAAEIEAMRSGRLHIAGFSSGPTCFAVNLAGYVPIAVKGYEKEFQGYRLIVIVKKDSPITTLQELKGNKVAHTTPSSNSGHLAPMVLFPKEGVVPGNDYTMVFSGKHDRSILGVAQGEYDAACVASDIFTRMAESGAINADDFRIVWQSAMFPSSSYGYAYDLHPDLVEKIQEAFAEYRFPPVLQKYFSGADRFYPISYKDDFALVRLIAKESGEQFDEKGFAKMRVAEEKAEAAKRATATEEKKTAPAKK